MIKNRKLFTTGIKIISLDKFFLEKDFKCKELNTDNSLNSL